MWRMFHLYFRGVGESVGVLKEGEGVAASLEQKSASFIKSAVFIDDEDEGGAGRTCRPCESFTPSPAARTDRFRTFRGLAAAPKLGLYKVHPPPAEDERQRLKVYLQ